MSEFIDKNTVKEALRELIKEDPETFKKILNEIFDEQNNSEFELLIQKNFRQYDATFRALA